MKSFFWGIVAAFGLLSVAIAGSAYYFLFFSKPEGALPQLAMPGEVEATSSPQASYRIQGTLKIPSFHRQKFSGSLRVVMDLIEVKDKGPWRPVNTNVMATIPAESIADGVARFDINLAKGQAEAIAGKEFQFRFMICRNPVGVDAVGCASPKGNEGLVFRSYQEVPKVVDGSLVVDVGALGAPIFFPSLGTTQPCDLNDSLAARVVPSASFLKSYPAGTPLMLLLPSTGLEHFIVLMDRGRRPAEMEAAFVSEGLGAYFLFAEPMKLDPAGMAVRIPGSKRWTGGAYGLVVVCRPNESKEACASRAFPVPRSAADPARGIFMLQGQDLKLAECRQKDFVFHLHDYSKSADFATLPKELKESH